MTKPLSPYWKCFYSTTLYCSSQYAFTVPFFLRLKFLSFTFFFNQNITANILGPSPGKMYCFHHLSCVKMLYRTCLSTRLANSFISNIEWLYRKQALFCSKSEKLYPPDKNYCHLDSAIGVALYLQIQLYMYQQDWDLSCNCTLYLLQVKIKSFRLKFLT